MGFTEFITTNRIRGAVFDMDGTLTDSMGGWNEIYAELTKYLKIELPQGFMMKVNHIPMRERVKVIINEFHLPAEENEVYAYWVERATGYYKSVFTIKPYMLETLQTLKSLNIKMAIATASDRRCAEAFIKSNRLAEYIGSVTGLDEVSRPKSFPDIYLKAAQKLGVQPYECIVFEDALTAIKGAKSGNFKVCGVQDDCSKDDEQEIRNYSDFILGFEVTDLNEKGTVMNGILKRAEE